MQKSNQNFLYLSAAVNSHKIVMIKPFDKELIKLQTSNKLSLRHIETSRVSSDFANKTISSM